MFKNRSFLVKMVNDNPNPDSNCSSDTTIGDTMYIMHGAAHKFALGGIAIVGSYIAADTLRQVIVHTAKVKIK